MTTLQTKSVKFIISIFILSKDDTIKLSLPIIDEIPARWREKIAKSTLNPECPFDLKGG